MNCSASSDDVVTDLDLNCLVVFLHLYYLHAVIFLLFVFGFLFGRFVVVLIYQLFDIIVHLGLFVVWMDLVPNLYEHLADAVWLDALLELLDLLGVAMLLVAEDLMDGSGKIF